MHLLLQLMLFLLYLYLCLSRAVVSYMLLLLLFPYISISCCCRWALFIFSQLAENSDFDFFSLLLVCLIPFCIFQFLFMASLLAILCSLFFVDLLHMSLFDFPFKYSLFINIGTRCVCMICLCLHTT